MINVIQNLIALVVVLQMVKENLSYKNIPDKPHGSKKQKKEERISTIRKNSKLFSELNYFWKISAVTDEI